MIITTSAETNLVRLNAATVVASMVIKPETVALILSARWLLKAVTRRSYSVRAQIGCDASGLQDMLAVCTQSGPGDRFTLVTTRTFLLTLFLHFTSRSEGLWKISV